MQTTSYKTDEEPPSGYQNGKVTVTGRLNLVIEEEHSL